MVEAISGSNKRTARPELIYHEGNTLMWNVEGSRVYRVEIKLPAGFALDSSSKEPLNSVTVSCTCPDAFKRKTARQRLCKHANSCFLTLVDSTAEEHLQKAKRQQIAREVKETTRALSQFEEERLQEEKRISQLAAKQDAELPGERERILYGLRAKDPAEIVEILRQRLDKDTDGLRLLSQLLPASVLKPRNELPCYRCGHKYDPNYPSSCVRAHPESAVELLHDGETLSQEKHHFRCSRCNKRWYGKTGQYFEVVDANTPACFTGAHVDTPQAIQHEKWP